MTDSDEFIDKVAEMDEQKRSPEQVASLEDDLRRRDARACISVLDTLYHHFSMPRFKLDTERDRRIVKDVVIMLRSRFVSEAES